MDELHSLLKRQIRRFIGDTKPFPEEQTDLWRAINAAYWQFDADRRMLEHSLELTSQELLEANAALSRRNMDLEMRVAARTAELSSSEARFRSLFEHAPVSIWEEDFSAARQYIDDLRRAGVVDFAAYFDAHPEAVAENAARVKIVDVNRATLEIYQAESKAQLLADLSKVLGPESLISFKAELLALAGGATSFENETINYTLRGEGRVIFLRLTVAPGSEETWERIFVGISDITKRRQAEAALAAERDLLQALMDNIPDTIYFKDTASRFTRINRAQVSVLGVVAPEDAVGKTDLDFFQDSELARGFYEEEQHIIETGESLINHIEFNPTPDGKPRWFSATKVPIKDLSERVIGIVGISRDITQRMHVEESLREAELKYRTLVEYMPAIIYVDLADESRNTLYISPQIQEMLGYAPEDWTAKPDFCDTIIHPEDRERMWKETQRAEANGRFSCDYRYIAKDGRVVWVHDEAILLKNEAGEPSVWQGVMLDITAQKEAEEALRQSEETIRYQNEMLSNLHQITLDLLRYRELDPLLHALVELSAKFLDAPFVEIMLLEEDTLVVKATTHNQLRLMNSRVSRSDGLLSWAAFDTHEPAVLSDYASWSQRQAVYDEFSVHAVADFPILDDDQCLGVLALGRDRPEHEFTPDQIQYGRLFANLTALVLNSAQLREALREQSIRDLLTGLYNRHYMEEAMQQHLTRVTRQLHPLGIIMLDIDHFKRINDTYGHAGGDALLREMGQLLKKHVRNEDIACRYGGEEFILIMPDASLEATQQRAEYLRLAIKELRVQHAGLALDGISISLGVAIYPEHGRTKEAVLHAADTALYRAKQQGRDQVVVVTRADIL